MTKRTKRQYRIRNWPDYNKALISRGSLTLWVEQRAINAWRDHSRPARPGRRRTYTDTAILCALTLREVYALALRATQGLVSSVLKLLDADLPTPHYWTLSRRAARLQVSLPPIHKGPLHLAIDSTGVKVYGEGEWKVRLHQAERRRTWRKLHIAIDHTTHEVVSLSMTDKDVLDRAEVPYLLKAVQGEVSEVLGDGAYDFEVCHRAIFGRGARGGQGAVEERGRVSPQESSGNCHDEDQDCLLGPAQGQRVEEAGDGVEGQVRGHEQDDRARNA